MSGGHLKLCPPLKLMDHSQDCCAVWNHLGYTLSNRKETRIPNYKVMIMSTSNYKTFKVFGIISLAFGIGISSQFPALAGEDTVTVRRVITTTQTKRAPETPVQVDRVSQSTSTISTRGVGFKNANVVEFKYKERLKNFKEQLKMGETKGWLTDKEILEFKEKIDVLEQMEKKISAKGYPKAETDNMEKMFTLYNQQFHKASTTPMAKKKSVDSTSKQSKTSTKSKTQTKNKGAKTPGK